MNKIVVIGGNEEMTHRLATGQEGRRSRLKVTRKDWRTVKHHPSTLSDADILLVDLTAPDAYTPRGLTNLHQIYPEIPLVLRTDADLSHPNALTRLLKKPNVDFVRSSADTDEVKHRLWRLLRLPKRQEKAVEVTSEAMTQKLVQELHHPDNGRLDARRIAEFFGIPLAEVARALGVSLSRLHKTPAATSVQEGLFAFERIAYALRILAGSPENTRIWLNLPEAQLEERTPLSFLREGRAEIVAQMLDDMLLGQPS